MTCYHPVTAYRSVKPNKNGKYPIIFNKKSPFAGEEIKIKCNNCIGCRLDYSLHWAIRCVNEAQMHENNCFITLTFSDQYLNKDLSLEKDDYQKFMKRLRREIEPLKISYYACGEYGSLNHRPHWHACIFNFKPDDLVLWQIKHGVKLYRSATLEKLWPFGFVTVGEVTFESAAYVARYMTKKIKGEMALSHYAIVDYNSGEVLGFREPERSLISTKPAIGAEFAKKYIKDIYPDDFVFFKKQKLKPPLYYDKIYDTLDPEGFQKIKKARVDRAKERSEDYTEIRLKEKEEMKLRKIEKLKRRIEGDQYYD